MDDTVGGNEVEVVAKKEKRDIYWGRGERGLDDAVSYWTNKQTVISRSPFAVERLEDGVIYYVPKGCNSGQLWKLCQAVAEKKADDTEDPGWGIVCCNTCNKFLKRPVATNNFMAHTQSSNCNTAKRKFDLITAS
jgi:hypothetical protein